jgi:peptidylprolyl isomerase
MASNNKRVRQQQAARRARLAAAKAARERARRKRWTIGGVITLLALIVILFAVLIGNNGNTTTSTAAGNSTTTVPPTTDTTISAKGKPCVARVDPLPAGAPDVPVAVGPPPTALVSQDLKEGTGAVIKDTDTLTVNYIGVSCSTGKIFDSSYKNGAPATFPLNQVIPGWTQGLTGMKVGGERLLGIPPDLAYGDQAQGPDIAADETLWFVVDVLDAKAA